MSGKRCWDACARRLCGRERSHRRARERRADAGLWGVRNRRRLGLRGQEAFLSDQGTAPRRAGRDSRPHVLGAGCRRLGQDRRRRNAADASRNLSGVFTGFDRRFGDWRAGLAAGYSNSSVSVSPRASSANIDTAYVAAYAGTSFWAWNFRSGATFAWNTIAPAAQSPSPAFFEQATTRYGAGEAQVFGELGYGLTFGAIAAEPFAGWPGCISIPQASPKTGGVSALAGTGNRDDVGYSTLGARVATYYLLQNGMALIPRASVAWQHAFGDVTPTAALSFQSTGAGFNILGVPIARDAALVEAAAICSSPRRPRSASPMRANSPTVRTIHSVKGNFTWRFLAPRKRTFRS